MPEKKFNYKRAVWILSIVIIFRLLYLLVAFLMIKNIAEQNGNEVPVSIIFNFWNVFFLVLFILELVICIVMRNRNLDRTQINIHLFALVLANVIFPLINSILTIIYPFSTSPAQVQESISLIGKIFVMLNWTFLILGHIFFIYAIVNGLIQPKQLKEPAEPTGFLDEFADRQ